jgi:TPR repeat protein
MKKAFLQPPTQRIWHSDSAALGEAIAAGNDAQEYRLLPAGGADIQKVVQAYQHHAVPNYELASIETVEMLHLTQRFESHFQALDLRASNPKYQPTWLNEDSGTRLAFRQDIVKDCSALSAPYTQSDYPHVQCLPLWHGTKDGIAEHIFKGGYGIFTSNTPGIVTDEGFFGKGIYSAYEAEYTFRCYAQQHGNQAVLILNWVSFYQIYPVIDGDMPKIRGKIGGYAQCDAHFARVRSDDHPHTVNYYPCRPGQAHQYTEIVVFNEAQCLPRYRVKLRQRVIAAPLSMPQQAYYEQGLMALQEHDYTKAQTLLANAASHGNALANIRYHWLVSGGSEVLPRSSDEAIENAKQRASDRVKHVMHQACPLTVNDADAQFALGWCYAQGIGVPEDWAEAAKNYTLAACQGHGEAQYQLARCYSVGSGVNKQVQTALFYYEQAAQGGHAPANYTLSAVYMLGLWNIPANEQRARQYRLAAHAAGHPAARLSPESPSADEYYTWGEQQERSKVYEMAAKAYQMATDKGHTKARTNLGLFFLTGRGGCPKDPKQAYCLWKQSAEEGHPRAMKNLAKQLRQGLGVPKDTYAANAWETKAASKAGMK